MLRPTSDWRFRLFEAEEVKVAADVAGGDEVESF